MDTIFCINISWLNSIEEKPGDINSLKNVWLFFFLIKLLNVLPIIERFFFLLGTTNISGCYYAENAHLLI